ncbi:MAG TPA: DUF4926 domain-containing protein [Tepidisphaeraceae bacterium]|nr:DUF4926 domain-containing protein [Tepidisphaeraceae bacterium]
MLNEYDCVRLRRALPNAEVPVGYKGVILMVYKEPKPGYEVEFFDALGKSLKNFSVEEDYVEKWQE